MISRRCSTLNSGTTRPLSGMRAQPLDPGNDLSSKPFPRIRRAFVRVIGLHVLKVLDR